ncbi:hypothetical protein C8F04DRAFT_1094612 [Mycena alexandri]|uniref:BTB domain-containing protein n=1 Tax=Mycena alexandri TaxID=1745969 RepID=A0AAD6SZC7_9AGAR|nr:hypothetical protein C8F04DRAFT_1094612 [Mycena alexandri]
MISLQARVVVFGRRSHSVLDSNSPASTIQLNPVMSDATVPPPFVPQAPFQGPGGDVILRSSDGIDFYVYRIVLSLASPVFEHMFGSSQPPSESDTLPVVPMAESAIILDRSLRFFYPGAEPVVDSVGQLCDILELLIGKYDTQSLVSLGKRFLRDYIDAEPLACFAVAIRLGWQDIARTAARKCLSLPLLTPTHKLPNVWKNAPGTAYYHLLQYHYRCGEAARASWKDLSWTQACRCTRYLEASCHLPGTKGYGTMVWFIQYLQASAEMAAINPSPDIIDDCSLISKALQGIQNCPDCKGRMSKVLPEFISTQWWPHIKSEIAKVELDLEF